MNFWKLVFEDGREEPENHIVLNGFLVWNKLVVLDSGIPKKAKPSRFARWHAVTNVKELMDFVRDSCVARVVDVVSAKDL